MAATAGVATFADSSGNGGAGGNRLDFGSEGDLKIYHDGTNNYILNDAGASFYIQNDMGGNSYENNIVCTPNAAVQLYYNGQLKFQTTNDGTSTTGIATATGVSATSNLTVGSGITMGSAGVATFSGTGDVHLLDNVQLNVGDASDLVIKHDGSHSRIQDTGTGYLILNTNTGVLIKNGADDENIAIFSPDGACELNYNATKKFETTNDGTVVTGMSTATTGFALPDGAQAVGSASIDIGTSKDLQIYHHSNNHSYMINNNGAGQLYIASNITKIMNEAVSETCASFTENGNVELYYDNSVKLATTNDGVVVTGIMTASTGVNYDGLLSEKFNTTAGKLSANTNIDLENGMIHYFSTQETTTSTPNIRYSSSKSLNNMLSTGDAITVTIITTAASGGYSAQLTIDGSAVTEDWVGGSAPSAGGSDGLDIYVYTILKTASATYKVIGNLTNAT